MEIHSDTVQSSADGVVQVRKKEETRPWHLARSAAIEARRRREREEIAEAISLGVEVVPKVHFDKTWQEWEDTVIREHVDDINLIRKKLPHRSESACYHRRSLLGLRPEFKPWTNKEDKIIRDNYLKVSNSRDLAPLLPSRSTHSIYNRLYRLGLKIPPAASDTGNTIVDAIKDRCRVLGYTMYDLDQMAGTGTYFKRKLYRRGTDQKTGQPISTQISIAIVKAVIALGGELSVQWPD